MAIKRSHQAAAAHATGHNHVYEIFCDERKKLVLNVPAIAMKDDGHILAIIKKVEIHLEKITGPCQKDDLVNTGRVAVVDVRWWEEFVFF